MREYEVIVEFSFNPKVERFVIRFLDGKNYTLDVIDLPKKFQSKKPNWENTYISADKSSLVIKAGSEIREIPSYIIHSKGNLVQ